MHTPFTSILSIYFFYQQTTQPCISLQTTLHSTQPCDQMSFPLQYIYSVIIDMYMHTPCTSILSTYIFRQQTTQPCTSLQSAFHSTTLHSHSHAHAYIHHPLLSSASTSINNQPSPAHPCKQPCIQPSPAIRTDVFPIAVHAITCTTYYTC